MIIKTSTGVLLHGTLAKDPEIRNAGQKQVLKFDIKAHSVKNAAGNWEGLYVQVNVWHGLEQWDGMLQKGDYVTVYARELKSREYNGKTYYNVDADDIQPGGLVTFRWMQTLADMMAAPTAPEMTPTEEATPFDPPPAPTPVQTTLQTSLQGGQMYPGEHLADYAPRSAAATAADLPADDALIEDTEGGPAVGIDPTRGFVAFPRGLTDWEWYTEPNTARLFFHLLLTANWQEKQWQGITIHPGELVTSQSQLAKQLGLSVRNVRTALEHLQVTGYLTVKTGSKYSVISINNYTSIVAGDRQSDRQVTGN